MQNAASSRCPYCRLLGMAFVENTERSSRWCALFLHVPFDETFQGFAVNDFMQKQKLCGWWCRVVLFALAGEFSPRDVRGCGRNYGGKGGGCQAPHAWRTDSKPAARRGGSPPRRAAISPLPRRSAPFRAGSGDGKPSRRLLGSRLPFPRVATKQSCRAADSPSDTSTLRDNFRFVIHVRATFRAKPAPPAALA